MKTDNGIIDTIEEVIEEEEKQEKKYIHIVNMDALILVAVFLVSMASGVVYLIHRGTLSLEAMHNIFR